MYGSKAVRRVDHSVRMHRMSWNAELDAGLEVCGVGCPFHRALEGERKKEKKNMKKCFAHSHKPLKEFLDIKAGVMTVKFLLTRRLSRTHLQSRCVPLFRCASVFAYRRCQGVVFTLWRFS